MEDRAIQKLVTITILSTNTAWSVGCCCVLLLFWTRVDETRVYIHCMSRTNCATRALDDQQLLAIEGSKKVP